MTKPDLSFSTQGLAEGCTAVADGTQTETASIETAALLKILRSFASIPAVDLIDAQPTITIAVAGGGEFIVRNESGTLYLTQVPTAENSAMPKTPEEIVEFLDATFTPAEAEEAEEIVVKTSKGRSVANSPALLGGLLGVWAIVAFFVLREPGPEGVTLVTDSSRVESFADQMEGRYGSEEAEGDTVYVVEDGRFKIFNVTEAGVAIEPFDEVSFDFGQRDGKPVLVLENGAVLGRSAEGDLVFEDETYPRL